MSLKLKRNSIDGWDVYYNNRELHVESDGNDLTKSQAAYRGAKMISSSTGEALGAVLAQIADPSVRNELLLHFAKTQHSMPQTQSMQSYGAPPTQAPGPATINIDFNSVMDELLERAETISKSSANGVDSASAFNAQTSYISGLITMIERAVQTPQGRADLANSEVGRHLAEDDLDGAIQAHISASQKYAASSRGRGGMPGIPGLPF